MDKLRSVLNGRADDEETGIVTQISDGTTLSWGNRVRAFIVCFAVGMLFSILGTVFLWLPGGLALFAIFYTLGNLLSIGSTCFLMGPLKQLQRMFAETRIIATIIMLVMMALTLCAALWWGMPGLALLFCLLQFVAMTWYAISYIPFARDGVKSCLGSCIE